MKRSELIGERFRGVFGAVFVAYAVFMLVDAVRGRDVITGDALGRVSSVGLTVAAVVLLVLAGRFLFGESTREMP